MGRSKSAFLVATDGGAVSAFGQLVKDFDRCEILDNEIIGKAAMKIVHVIESIDPKFGGPQAVVQRIAAAQVALGHDVHIFAYCSPDAAGQVLELGAKIPKFDCIKWHILPQANVAEKFLCRQGRRRLTTAMRETSFVHLHGVWDPILLWAARLARKQGIPYCICTSGMLDVWSMQQRSLKKRIAFMLGYRRMLNSASFVHALNADEVDLMKPLGLRAPVVIIPNGIFPEEFEAMPPKGRFRDKIGLPAERRYVLFLSRLHFKKGLDTLAHAFTRIAQSQADVDLVVAGPAGGAEIQFAELIKKAGLEKRVHIVGPIYGQSKIEAMTDAECFCLPSRQEGFSIAITEALACAVPVVITDACHFPEVGTHKAGIVVSGEPDAVAHGLLAMLEDSGLRKRMGSNGRRLVMENFTWPVIANKTILNYGLYSGK